MTATATTPTQRASSTQVRAYQTFTVLAAAAVLWQFVTAGQLFPNGGPEEAHAGGAIVLHVFSGLAAVLAVLAWRRGQMTRGLMALSVVVFGYTFVQAALGGRSSLWIHVPGAMVLTVVITWQLVSALRLRATAPR
jgi:hypothetical protein